MENHTLSPTRNLRPKIIFIIIYKGFKLPSLQTTKYKNTSKLVETKQLSIIKYKIRININTNQPTFRTPLCDKRRLLVLRSLCKIQLSWRWCTALNSWVIKHFTSPGNRKNTLYNNNYTLRELSVIYEISRFDILPGKKTCFLARIVSIRLLRSCST